MTERLRSEPAAPDADDAESGVLVSGDTGTPRKRGATSRARALIGLLLLQVATFVLVIVIWEVFVDLGWLSLFQVSKPSIVVQDLGEIITDPKFGLHIWYTLVEIVLGLLIGTVAGVAAGVLFAMLPFLYRVATPLITTIYTLPRVALVGLFIIWFGIGTDSKTALVVSLVFFSMLFNTHRGVTLIDRRLIDNVRLMGGGRWTVVRQVYLPGTMPWIFSGLRISLIFSVTGAVVGEMLGSLGGLGYLLANYQNAFDSAGMFAVLVLIAVFANVLNVIFGLAERRVLRWSPTRDSAA